MYTISTFTSTIIYLFNLQLASPSKFLILLLLFHPASSQLTWAHNRLSRSKLAWCCCTCVGLCVQPATIQSPTRPLSLVQLMDKSDVAVLSPAKLAYCTCSNQLGSSYDLCICIAKGQIPNCSVQGSQHQLLCVVVCPCLILCRLCALNYQMIQTRPSHVQWHHLKDQLSWQDEQLGCHFALWVCNDLLLANNQDDSSYLIIRQLLDAAVAWWPFLQVMVHCICVFYY